LIVSTAGGYVAGTYLSTSALAAILGGTGAALGAGALTVTGATSAMIGSAGIFGTSIGATGLTGALMSAGLISSTPVAVPLAAGAAIVGSCYLSYVLLRLRKKLRAAVEGQEAQFTSAEAKFFEVVVKRLGRSQSE
jgi:hypothetical protein